MQQHCKAILPAAEAQTAENAPCATTPFGGRQLLLVAAEAATPLMEHHQRSGIDLERSEFVGEGSLDSDPPDTECALSTAGG